MTEINEALFNSNGKSADQQYHKDLETFVKSKPNSFVRDYHKNLPRAKPMRKKERLIKISLPRAEPGKKIFKPIKTELPKKQQRDTKW